MAHDVFISYASEDKIIANAVCSRLESAGLRCWIAPRDILPGVEWSAAIVDAIENSCVCVLIFSVSANNSEQVNREVERAVKNGKAVIPFRLEEIQPSKSLEYFISTSHWLDAITPPVERHIDRLSVAIKELMSGSQDRHRPIRAANSAMPKGGLRRAFATILFIIVGIVVAVYLTFVARSTDNSHSVDTPPVAPPPSISSPSNRKIEASAGSQDVITEIHDGDIPDSKRDVTMAASVRHKEATASIDDRDQQQLRKLLQDTAGQIQRLRSPTTTMRDQLELLRRMQDDAKKARAELETILERNEFPTDVTRRLRIVHEYLDMLAEMKDTMTLSGDPVSANSSPREEWEEFSAIQRPVSIAIDEIVLYFDEASTALKPGAE